MWTPRQAFLLVLVAALYSKEAGWKNRAGKILREQTA
jgi:hypothetical protein